MTISFKKLLTRLYKVGWHLGLWIWGQSPPSPVMKGAALSRVVATGHILCAGHLLFLWDLDFCVEHAWNLGPRCQLPVGGNKYPCGDSVFHVFL